MDLDHALPRWAGAVPAAQLGTLTLYVVGVLIGRSMPAFVTETLLIASPVAFGTLFAVGMWIARRRRARGEGRIGELALLGNCLTGVGFVASSAFWLLLAALWFAL